MNDIDMINDDPQLLYLFLHRHITDDESLDMNCCYMDGNSLFYIVRSPRCSVRVDIAGGEICDSAILLTVSARDLDNSEKGVMRETFYVQAPYLRKSQLSFTFSLMCLIHNATGEKMPAPNEKLKGRSVIPNLRKLEESIETACTHYNVRKALEGCPVRVEPSRTNRLSDRIPLLTIRRTMNSQPFVKKLTYDAVKRSSGLVYIEGDYITTKINILNAVRVSEESIADISDRCLGEYEPQELLKSYFTKPECLL